MQQRTEQRKRTAHWETVTWQPQARVQNGCSAFYIPCGGDLHQATLAPPKAYQSTLLRHPLAETALLQRDWRSGVVMPRPPQQQAFPTAKAVQ